MGRNHLAPCPIRFSSNRLTLGLPSVSARVIAGQIMPSREFYSYEAKYIDGNSQLLIPAPIPFEISEEARSLAVRAFRAVDCAGMARVDFLLDKDSEKLYVNEINT